jgi:hypothetical protein
VKVDFLVQLFYVFMFSRILLSNDFIMDFHVTTACGINSSVVCCWDYRIMLICRGFKRGI